MMLITGDTNHPKRRERDYWICNYVGRSDDRCLPHYGLWLGTSAYSVVESDRRVHNFKLCLALYGLDQDNTH